MATDASGGRSLRVLLTVHHHLERGAGAPGATIALCDELERRGHRVELVGLGLLSRNLGATTDAVRFPWAVARLVECRLAHDDLDVIDASTGDLAHVDQRLVRASSTAVFTRSHGLEPLADAARRRSAAVGGLDLRRRYALYHGGLRLREVVSSLRAADGVMVLNACEASYVRATVGLSPERIWQTAPLVDDSFRAVDRAETRDLLVLGPASWRKGADTSIRVIEAVLRAQPDALATWSGLDDPTETRARLADDVRSRVQLLERYDAPQEAALLATHRVLLFASRFEGLPVTLLEALCSGIVTVGSDIPGVRDLLASGAGLLVPEGHVEGLAGAVQELLTDSDQRRARGATALQTAASYRTSCTVDHLEDAYRTVLSVKDPAP